MAGGRENRERLCLGFSILPGKGLDVGVLFGIRLNSQSDLCKDSNKLDPALWRIVIDDVVYEKRDSLYNNDFCRNFT
jgi:hypothetical protein